MDLFLFKEAWLLIYNQVLINNPTNISNIAVKTFQPPENPIGNGENKRMQPAANVTIVRPYLLANSQIALILDINALCEFF
jgi:hypothetical protein